MLHIRCGDENALVAVKSTAIAYVEKALDFLINPADCLNEAVLIDRPGHGVALPNRHIGECREQSIELGG
jgi:hypothetical protein